MSEKMFGCDLGGCFFRKKVDVNFCLNFLVFDIFVIIVLK